MHPAAMARCFQMPDRPGALGQVASRIGAVRGDVLAIEILEHGAGRAIDELSVRLPDASVLDLLAAEVSAVDGVDVESIRAVDEDRADPSLAALGVAAALAECPVEDRAEILCRGVQRIAEAEWAVLLRDEEIVHVVGDAPAGPWLAAFIAGSEHLDGVDDNSGGGVNVLNVLNNLGLVGDIIRYVVVVDGLIVVICEVCLIVQRMFLGLLVNT